MTGKELHVYSGNQVDDDSQLIPLSTNERRALLNFQPITISPGSLDTFQTEASI